MKQPSGSNAEAFARCTASHVLPQSDSHNDYMDRGSEGHEPLAAAINARTPKTTDRGMALVREFPLARVTEGVTERRAEAAYVVNVEKRSSQFLGTDIGRDYEKALGRKLRRHEIPTTLDLDGYRGRRYIRDWKFGKSASLYQLLVQGMAVAYEPGAAIVEIDAGFVFIDGETHGRVWEEDKRILSLEEIDCAADQLVRAWKRADEMEEAIAKNLPVTTTEGSWCIFCGAYPYCPAKTRLVRHLLDEIAADEAVAALTAEQCGQAWAKLQEIRKLADRMYEALKGRAMVEPLPLPNGKRLRMVDIPGRRMVNLEEATKLLEELGATPEQVAKVIKKGASYQSPKETKL